MDEVVLYFGRPTFIINKMTVSIETELASVDWVAALDQRSSQGIKIRQNGTIVIAASGNLIIDSQHIPDPMSVAATAPYISCVTNRASLR